MRMDPDETLRLLIEAAEQGDSTALWHHATVLCEWIESGGFTPRVLAALYYNNER